MTTDYTLIRSSRKTLALTVHPDGRVEVRAPLRLHEQFIRAFVESKHDWIAKKQAQLARQATPARQFAPGERFLFLGQDYPLEMTDVQRPALRLGSTFLLAQAALPQARQVFTRWYRARAANVLAQRVKACAAQFGLHYHAIRISSARTRWGSCSSAGTLSFTWRLVMAPLDVIDYVVIHELAHLRVRNHSSAFWDQVASMLPDYPARRDWLKKNGHLLTLD